MKKDFEKRKIYTGEKRLIKETYAYEKKPIKKTY